MALAEIATRRRSFSKALASYGKHSWRASGNISFRKGHSMRCYAPTVPHAIRCITEYVPYSLLLATAFECMCVGCVRETRSPSATPLHFLLFSLTSPDFSIDKHVPGKQASPAEQVKPDKVRRRDELASPHSRLALLMEKWSSPRVRSRSSGEGLGFPGVRKIMSEGDEAFLPKGASLRNCCSSKETTLFWGMLVATVMQANASSH